MKKTIVMILALLCEVVQGTWAQDPGASSSFKLWFANNVTDVQDFDKITSAESGLEWREVHDKDIDGNSAEVDRVRQMLASTGMKGIEQQRQFWTMRDRTLLCFRIDDADRSTPDSYEVEVTNTDSGERLSKTVTKFFFVNLPLVTPPSSEYAITVTDLDEPSQKIRFKYTVYDWNNDNLYIFQLDRQRQLTGKGYEMEYSTGYMDEEGFMQKETKTLPLKEKSFQSFYVPEGSDLLDVVLIGDENKLRINKGRLHPGIDLEDRFTKMQLSPSFWLDKHEDREFVNFNWLGSGLFEKYDTLFITLYDERSMPIRNATMHVEQVDAEGRPTHSTAVRYIDYDASRQVHRILTRGKPAYIEILANNYLPTVYKYKGAADEETGFVDEDRCSAVITLKKQRYNPNELVCSETYFMNLNDEKAIVVRGGVDHELCTIDEVNLAMKTAVDTVGYTEDCGMDYPKLLDNKPIERYAKLQALFSRPHGTTTPECRLYATDLETRVMREANDREVQVLTSADYHSFERDYYFARFSLLNVIPQKSTCQLKLTAGDLSYEKFPYFHNIKADREKDQEAVDKEVNEKYTGASDMNMSTGFADADFDLKLPAQFKFSFSPVNVTTSIEANFRKQMFTFKVNVSTKRDSVAGKHETKEMSRQRTELKAKETYENSYGEFNKTVSGTIVGDKVKHKDKDNKVKDWVYKAADDIFDFSNARTGIGWFGGAQLELKCGFNDKGVRFQVAKMAGTIGYGFGASTTTLGGKAEELQKKLDKLKKYVGITFSGAFEVSAQLDFGLRTFDNSFNENISSANWGYFARLSGRARIGATAQVSTPKCINALFNVQAGFRVGAKAGFGTELAGPFQAVTPGFGAEFAAVAVGQLYLNLRTVVFQTSLTAGFSLGARALVPDDNTNPFHSDFPYWIEKKKIRSVGNAFRSVKAPAVQDYGTLLVGDVSSDANPHFLDGNHVVYNDLRAPKDYNDDRIAMVAIDEAGNGSPATLSAEGTAATNHNRSKRGEHEIVVYEQLNTTVDNASVTDDNAAATSNKMMKHTRVRASVLQDGQWKQTEVSDPDMPEGVADLKPFVTMQEDGHAAVIYQHGRIIDDATASVRTADTSSFAVSSLPAATSSFAVSGLPADTGEGSDAAPDFDTSKLASLDGIQFDGQLMIKTFDGQQWSKATPLFPVSSDNVLTQYDLMMRNDTVLVAAAMKSSSDEGLPRMKYASVAIVKGDGNNGNDGSNAHSVSYVDEPLRPHNFFLNRVGQNAVATILYEGTDSIRDIYVKTLNMDGHSDGRAGSDLGIDYRTPMRVKIVCDREAHRLNDFAVLWTEQNTVKAADDDDTEPEKNSKMGTVLNASRIHLNNALQITAPITVGAEQDGLVMTDFDGFLDDAHIRVAYTLADTEHGSGIIMKNDQYFTNSFDYDVSYARQSLLGSSTLPINVEIANTGTSAIQAATATINGQDFALADAYVAPFSKKMFTVNYPITDDFDGYITSKVAVEYNNVFKARSHPRRGISFLRQQQEQPKECVIVEDVECDLVSRSIEDGRNEFLVELTDHGGLHDGVGIHVGIFTHPNGSTPISEGAEVLVTKSDFRKIGDKLKAYVPISVDGILEPTEAYVNCHLIDIDHTDDNDGEVYIDNVRGSDNAFKVQLFPVDNPTTLVRMIEANKTASHRVTVTTQDGGATLSGLTNGEGVRIFNAEGMTICNRKADASTLYVPLPIRGTYILSTENEIYKFQY